MTKLKLSKQSLHHEQEQLKLYKRLLPSLDLKRRQLTMETQKAQEEHAAAVAQIDALETRIGEELPMLADQGLPLRDLVVVKGYKLGEQNIVGVRLPILESLDCQVAEYSLLATPAWLDILVQRLKDAKTCRLRAEIAAQRLDILRLQLRRVTQRVNLFDKILIPTARKNIQRIRIYLGETERAAVVTSKLAKSKQLQGRNALAEASE
ncbi:V-type ATP synthase subunit D [Methylomicrobium sp. Wu6]|uniref:V-type ATP synthase subunit D n=1 Tax=Methylomicrobium sp. Wu6 TaxID=3107928 RepID=UPI002DD64ED9|nr:V-type ATP synthase subunit D [Methylomicrobium sp. Wu6]MEC4747245.1 V-type ATP synthase subunit D [Methylomicrobium sp. Wu6]